MPSLRVLSLVLAAALAAGTLAPAPAEARERGTSAPLSQRLGGRVDQAGVKAGKLGVAVVDLETGALVFERGGDLALIPASVAKLATAVAALDALGPGHRFRTAVAGRGTLDPATGVLAGDLVLVGSGDPSLSKRDHPNEPLWPFPQLAAAVRKLGITAVTGALVLDDAPFDRVFVHPTWSASDLDDWYGAPVAGLTFNDGCATVVVRGAGAAGRPAQVSFPRCLASSLLASALLVIVSIGTVQVISVFWASFECRS